MERFTEVLASLGTEEEFLAGHPHPALLLEPPDEAGEESKFDTREIKLDDLARAQDTTDVLSPDQARKVFQGAASLVHADARVAWLRKSERNPFLGMVTIGRATNNDVCIPHGSISKVHAIVHRENDGWSIEDRTSTNGTFVDGVRVPAQQRRPLSDGAKIRLAEIVQARFFGPGSFYQFLKLNRGS